MNNINKIPKIPSFTNNYSNAKINSTSNKINSNISVNHGNNYSENSIQSKKKTHEYKAMDGKIYYDERLLDFANKQFLENQMKRNNTIK